MSPATTLSSLGLSKKTLAALDKVDISTIGDVLKNPESDLRALAPAAADDILDILKHYNLTLPDATRTIETADTQIAQEPIADSLIQETKTSHEVVADPEWLRPARRPGGTDQAEELAEELFGYRPQKRAKKTGVLTDDDRALKFAGRHKARSERSPRLDNPDDIERLRKLRLSTTMEPIDAAWMYGVSVDAVYSELKAGRMPHTRFGRLYKIPTAQVFEQLLPDWKPPAPGSNEPR